MIAQHPLPRKALRNWAVAGMIALVVSLAPIVQSDTVSFFHMVFAAGNSAALVRADITK
jgi:hypothetical protein